MPGNGKKGTSSIVLCMRKVSVRSVQVLCINEVIATKKVTEKVKKWWKIAILWLFLSHRGCHMAPRPQKHEYLLATMFCTKFEHFRMSGSIICTQLFLSLTRCFKGTSFFGDSLNLSPFFVTYLSPNLSPNLSQNLSPNLSPNVSLILVIH